MNTLTIHYGNLKKSPFLDEEIRRQFERLEPVSNDKADIEVWLSKEGSDQGARKPMYETLLRVTQNQYDIFVKKSQENFFKSIRDTFSSARKTMKRRKEKNHDFKKANRS